MPPYEVSLRDIFPAALGVSVGGGPPDEVKSLKSSTLLAGIIKVVAIFFNGRTFPFLLQVMF